MRRLTETETTNMQRETDRQTESKNIISKGVARKELFLLSTGKALENPA